ncbi:MAG: ComEC/Rec2 family competence protein [Candidatus Pacebacteria bacterium]|nr:ComEC/Rec2 family competence protein [Candidatus Paceibacterota bacterium]MDD5013052.1 ComEC/Rec2 family competence protein [Candidatus Paceibacterota bacterium]MDD5753069.1 ComEC/Rec2 family competence protein [Candidatus Paceibacterota bacterium]
MEIDNLFLFCIMFMGGIVIASFFNLWFLPFLFLIFGLSLIGVWFKKALTLGFCFIVLGLSFLYFNFYYSNTKANNFVFDKDISFSGIICKEPQLDYDKQKIVVCVDNSKISISANVFPEYDYGDKIQIKGKIKKPGMIEDFDYEGYLLKDGITAYMSYPQIKVIDKDQGNFFMNSILLFKKRMSQEIQKQLTLDKEAILEATILGNTIKMSDSLKQKLSLSGLSHAIAISGAHIVLFAGIIMEVLFLLGLWKREVLIFSIFFILFYVIFVGAPASALRSGFMIGLIYFAQIFERNTSNLRILFLAGLIILLINPLLLRYDLGFQLSFLATLGIIVLGSVFNYWLRGINIKWLREVLAMTISAQIFVLPILVINFGYFSLISLVSNILVFAVLPVIMILGILFPLLGLVSSFLSWIGAMVLSIFLSYLIIVIDCSAMFPLAKLEIPILLFFILYIPIILFALFQKRKKELEIFI